MRLILDLMPIGSEKYSINHNYKIMSFIYNLLEKTEFNYLHDAKQSGKNNNKRKIPFCFSNIFSKYGYSDIKHQKHILISSPDSNLILLLYGLFQKLINKKLRFGNLAFNLLNVKMFDCSNYSNKILTATPLIIRTPKSTYQKYNLDLRHQYEYVYWREQFPLELFLNQLQSNLRKKYISYYLEDPASELKFSSFVFKKQISQKLRIHGLTQTIISTIWEFWFDEPHIANNKLFRFALDAGLGERNSLGFGFVNPI